MATTFGTAVESYLRAKPLSSGTRNEYRSTVAGLKNLAGSHNLEAVELSHSVTAPAVEELRKALPGCKISY